MMRPGRGIGDLWAGVRHPWIAPFLLFYLGGLLTLALFQRTEALGEVLSTLLLGGIGLGLTAWATRGEGSRPGPATRQWMGLLLGLGLTLLAILRPEFVPIPIPFEPARTILTPLLWQALLPAAILLLSGVPWVYLGWNDLRRGWRRWRHLAIVLAGTLTLPALLQPQVVATCLDTTLRHLLFALPVAYAYALLARALPQEFLYRQVLQSRLQALLQRPTAAIVGQALLFGLAGAGRYIAQGEPWLLALLIATLQGSTLGLFYGLLRDRTGSLTLPLLLHAWMDMWCLLPQTLLWLGF